MPETELGEVEGANEAVDRPNRIVRTDIVLALDPGAGHGADGVEPARQVERAERTDQEFVGAGFLGRAHGRQSFIKIVR